MAGGRNGFRVHLTVLTSAAHGTAAANNVTRARRPLAYQKPNATKTAWLLFKIKQNRCLFLSVGRAADGGRASVGAAQNCSAARPVSGLGEKMSKTQSIWHPPALGLPVLYQVPAWTKWNETGRCYWGGDRHTQNQKKARLQWNEFSNIVSSPQLKLWRGKGAVML